jgi:TRAP-type uncharacterized transport system substrate-binding protein
VRKLLSRARPFAVVRISWPDFIVTVGPLLLVIVLGLGIAIAFVKPAVPHILSITAGARGSAFYQTAEEYRDILARDGVKLEILPSHGAEENLNRLRTPTFHVDVGFVQSGLADELETEGLVSLGSTYYEPIWVFYRGAKPVEGLRQLRGRRIAIGAEGGGTKVLALRLLKANGIDANSAVLREIGNEDAVQALRAGTVDAAFLLGNSSAPIVRELLQTPRISIVNFSQADAYTRIFPYLYKLVLPKGTLDLSKNLPAQDITLIGATAELIAREDLHSALSDLLIEAAKEVHGGPGLFRHRGEFPDPREHDFAISDDAQRYYKSGQRFLHRHLPFWLANIIDRALVLLVPIVALVIPGLRLAPAFYRWRVRSRLYRWYGALMAVEADMLGEPTAQQREELLKRIDVIEVTVNKSKMPVFIADQVYGLRAHIGFVRDRLTAASRAT